MFRQLSPDLEPGQSFLETPLPPFPAFSSSRPTTQNEEVRKMQQIVQKVHCPNCGSSAERHHILSSRLIRTQCHRCDYLMITCSETGRVIEAYAPGIASRR